MITAHVVYATITGNNEDIADIITERFEDQGVSVTESEISQTDPTVFENVNICVICPYTYDEGALPEEGLDFYDDLADLKLPHQVYGVAGSGDVFYEEFYCVAVDKFAATFEKTGAIKGSANIKMNLDPDEKAINDLDKFTDELIAKAQK